MEYNFRLADLFPSEISIVSSDLVPVGCPAVHKIGTQAVKKNVEEVLNTMGKASAEAQNLHHIITNAAKLRESNGEQSVYVICDFSLNHVVGLLKIGRKKLFIFDPAGQQHELNPLCILDFYVHETRQRCGVGRTIFEYMLQKEGVDVRHLAIDHPSDKFLFFFRKHYSLTQIIPQVNNFVVFDGFFANRTDYAGKKQRWRGLDQVDTETPAEHKRAQHGRTLLEDSRNYNKAPGLFLRNPTAGSMTGYSHVQNRLDSYNGPGGGIMQPPTGGGMVHRSANNITPNYQFNGNHHHHMHQQRLYSKPEPYVTPISVPARQQRQYQQQQPQQQNYRDLKYSHEPLW